jgi:asparaginyl-tRNA synthetase
MAGVNVLESLDALIAEVEAFEVQPMPVPDEKCPEFSGKFSLKHTSVKHLLSNHESFMGSTVTVCGWVTTVRANRFITIHDGASLYTLQLVADLENKALQDVVGSLSRGCSVKAVGKVVESAGKGQVIDIEVQTMTLLGPADPKKYPLPKVKKGVQSMKMETIREIQHMRARTRVIRAAQRVRNEVCKATHDFFYDRGFQYIHTPLITAADCEGAGEGFTVTTMLDDCGEPRKISDIPATKDGRVDFSQDFFKRHANLTVSGQLHVETYCHGVGSVYTFGPTFRAEESHTSRHLAEFWMIEPEIAFCEFSDVQDLAEDYLKYCLHRLLHNCLPEITALGERFRGEDFFKGKAFSDNAGYLKAIVDQDFARVSYTEGVATLVEKIESGAIKVIMHQKEYDAALKEVEEAAHVSDESSKMLQSWKESGKLVVIKDSDKIQIEDWKVTGPKKMRKKFGKFPLVFENPVYWGVDLSSEHEKYLTDLYGRPTILYNYPQAIKAFYMKANGDGKTVQACDVLVPGVGEVIGGSQREDDIEKLRAQIALIGIDEKDMSWYLDLRRFGSVPHGGFGLGLERLLMLATGIDNIRDIIPYPRYPGNCNY